MLHVIGWVLFLLSYAATVYAEDYTAYAKEQAQKQQQTIAPYASEVDAIIKNVLTRQAKPDMQTIKQELQTASKLQYSKVIAAPKSKQDILIFVSFSMPKASIKNWITQAQAAGAAVYIRGLVNNSFKATLTAVSTLVQDQTGGLLIDPSLFKKHGITQVPAVVVSSGDDATVLYGDVTLDYALTKIAKALAGAEQAQLLAIVQRLRTMSHG